MTKSVAVASFSDSRWTVTPFASRFLPTVSARTRRRVLRVDDDRRVTFWRLADVVRDARPLLVVVRHDAEEAPAPARVVVSEVPGRRPGHVREPCRPRRRGRDLDLPGQPGRRRRKREERSGRASPRRGSPARCRQLRIAGDEAQLASMRPVVALSMKRALELLLYSDAAAPVIGAARPIVLVIPQRAAPVRPPLWPTATPTRRVARPRPRRARATRRPNPPALRPAVACLPFPACSLLAGCASSAKTEGGALLKLTGRAS